MVAMDRAEARAVAAAALTGDDASQVADAVRQTLAWLAAEYPGRSVEVRVPPYRVVQIIEGSRHRRGTPPAVVETDPQTWLRLVAGQTDWSAARAAGLVTASGERSDLSGCF